MDGLFVLLVFMTIICVGIWSYLFLTRYDTSRLPLPPGPMSDKLPSYNPWAQLQDWGRKYGQFFYLRDGNILVINDLEVAVDLLERRSAIYSDRESSVMLEMCKLGDFNFAFMRYSNKWRRNRRTFQQTFRQATISRFFPAQYKEVHLFLRRLINTPSDCMQHCMALSQGAIYSSVYGLDLEPGHDIARKAIEVVHDLFDSVILQNGAFHLLNRFPWLRYMPSWFPGCHFKRLAAHAVQEQNQMRDVPFDLALNDFKTKSKPSLIAELVAQNEGNEKEVESLKAMASVSVIAAADTTGSSISSFILTMVMHPKVQTKGQEEIDRVIGADRLPTFADRPSLPYIESIYRELMRLHPPLPLCMRLECDYDASAALKLHPMFIGVSHASTKDDIYRGYCIPKGSIIVPNIWCMNRNPEIYPEPDLFLPERFLESTKGPFSSINDISAFGFGRRVCPGRYMAENSLWLCIVSTLATVNIRKAKDEQGNEIDISGEYSHNFLRHPLPFQCSIVPRSPHTKQLILSAV